MGRAGLGAIRVPMQVLATGGLLIIAVVAAALLQRHHPATAGSFATISVYDSHGFLNGGTAGGRGIAGDSFFALDLGPRLDRDGLAHLTVTDTVPQEAFTAPPPSTGWAFRFTLKVQASTVLPAPASFQLGSWRVTIENLAATPSVIDFQAVVAGANNEQLFGNMHSQPVVLLDAAGNQVRSI